MRPMRLVARAGPWVLSAALHAALGVAAYLTFAGMAASEPAGPPVDVVYSVTVEPGGSSPQVGDAADLKGPSYAMSQDSLPADDAPLAGVPEVEVSSIKFQEPTPGGTRGSGAVTQGFSHGSTVKLSQVGKAAGTGTGRGVG